MSVQLYILEHYGISFMYLDTGELPVTIDFIRYDRNPGYHNITIVANSTLGEMNYYTGVFFVQGALIHT